MLITKIKIGEYEPITSKNIPTYIATRSYSRCQKEERGQINLIATKKRF